jgi:Fungalysin metallopeptidase (M36)
MAINFIPNDPDAGAAAPAMRRKDPSPNRPSSSSGFTFSNQSAEGEADPGTPQFLFWQAREAAIAAVAAWEACAGQTHTAWQGNRKKLPLLQDAGEDLNAFYDRASFSFFHETVGAQTFFSGASTDVVSHEVGHGLLDSMRPDFFEVNFLEVAAFHEAFGDCTAILTALGDTETRQRLLAVAPNLRARDFVESTAEQLSRAIGLAIPGHNAAEPRHAFNTFKFQIPSTLPDNGGPGALINEVHSFGMIFTGCFWNLIANLFNASATQDEAALLAAAKLAGKILIEGARGAVVRPRFLQSIGRAMVLADQNMNGGANRQHINDAFARHDILLGANAMMAPTMALAGTAPKGAKLGTAAREDLRRRLGSIRGAKLSLSATDFFGVKAVNAVQTRGVQLGSVDPKLKGVVAMAHEPVIVGASGSRAAVMGAVPNVAETESEVKAFVGSLVAHRRIGYGRKAKKAAVAKRDFPEHVTHVVKSVGGRKVLQRVRFLCGCVRCGS